MFFHQLDPNLNPDNPGLWRSDLPHPSKAAEACTTLYEMSPGVRILCPRAHHPELWTPRPIALHHEPGSADLVAFSDMSAVLRLPFNRENDLILPVIFHLTPPPTQGRSHRFSFAPVFEGSEDTIFALPPLGLAHLSNPVKYTVSSWQTLQSEDPQCHMQANRLRHAIQRWADLAPKCPEIEIPSDNPRIPIRGQNYQESSAYDWPAALPCRGLTAVQMTEFETILRDLLVYFLQQELSLNALGLHLEPARLLQDGVDAPSLQAISVDQNGITSNTTDVATFRRLNAFCEDILPQLLPVDLSRICAVDDTRTPSPSERQDCTLRAFLTRNAIEAMSAHDKLRATTRFSAL